MPKVSVIIPCFNKEKFVGKAIESVLAQVYTDYEIIVINDGSTDDSQRVLQNYSSRIIILKHQNCCNKGQSCSLNLALNFSNSEYISILDADDLFLPNKLKVLVDFLDLNESVYVVYSNGFAIDENGNILYNIYKLNHREISDPNNLLLDCYILPTNGVFRRRLLAQSGLFDESLRAAQDHDFALRLFENSRVAYIDEPLFMYRRHANSISFKSAKTRWINGYYILWKAFKRYPYKKINIVKRLAVLNFRLGQCYMEEKNYFFALFLFLFSAMCDPFRAVRVILGKERITSHH